MFYESNKKYLTPNEYFGFLLSIFYTFLCYSSNHGNSSCKSLVTVLTCLRSGDKLYRIMICLCEQVLLCLYKRSFLLFILSFVPFIERKNSSIIQSTDVSQNLFIQICVYHSIVDFSSYIWTNPTFKIDSVLYVSQLCSTFSPFELLKKKTKYMYRDKNKIGKVKACTCIYTCYEIVSIMIFCMAFI